MTDSLLEFPCRFPIKAIGVDHPDFQPAVVRIISSHSGDLAQESISLSPSSNGRYLSVSVTITATSQQQLDAIYRELTAMEHVRFVL